ncbi:hypothetical protein [Streptomyces milbemycinicus]|uniref:hypothetical protein n=1 Tax=Streptomyces milbemycinicus TaxID=476552 RepID=UPI0033CAD4B6
MGEKTTSTVIERGMRIEELLSLPVRVDLNTANRALCLGRTKGFQLARAGQYPVPVKKIGQAYRVNRADLLRELGCDPGDSGRAETVSSSSR